MIIIIRLCLVEALVPRVKGSALKLKCALQSGNPLALIVRRKTMCGDNFRPLGSDSAKYAVSMIGLNEHATLITDRETRKEEQGQDQFSSFRSPADPKFNYEKSFSNPDFTHGTDPSLILDNYNQSIAAVYRCHFLVSAVDQRLCKNLRSTRMSY